MVHIETTIFRALEAMFPNGVPGASSWPTYTARSSCAVYTVGSKFALRSAGAPFRSSTTLRESFDGGFEAPDRLTVIASIECARKAIEFEFYRGAVGLADVLRSREAESAIHVVRQGASIRVERRLSRWTSPAVEPRRSRPAEWWSFSTPCGVSWVDHAVMSSGLATSWWSVFGVVSSAMEASER